MLLSLFVLGFSGFVVIRRKELVKDRRHVVLVLVLLSFGLFYNQSIFSLNAHNMTTHSNHLLMNEEFDTETMDILEPPDIERIDIPSPPS